jgi:hypothetical protein
MLKTTASRDPRSIAVVAGLFALLCLNVAVGLSRGFDRVDGGLVLRVVASPGVALGWGGVVLLVVAIPYALLAWIRGRRAGKLLSIIGAVVFAVAVGALVGVFSSPTAAGGGRLAGAIGAYLKTSLGAGLAATALAVIAMPSLLLALAPLILESGVVRVADAARKSATGVAGAPKPWYPERKIGPDGEEEPVVFSGSHDVGPVRFRDEADDAANGESAGSPGSTVSLSPPPVAGPAARKRKPIEGVRFADGLPDDAVAAPSIAAEEPLNGAPSVHAAVDVTVASSAATAIATAGASFPLARAPHAEPPLPDGVRYSTSSMEDEPPPAPPPETPPTFAEPPPVEAVSDAPLPVAERLVVEDLAFATADAVAADVQPLAPEPAPEPPSEPAAPTPAPARVAPSRPSEPRPAATPQSARSLVAAAMSVRLPVAIEAAAPSSDAPSTSGASYRRKLAATGLIDGPREEPVLVDRPARTRARPARPKDIQAAIRGLFSSLPLDELPPVQPVIDPPEAPPPEPRIEAPGQTALFDVTSASVGRHTSSNDPLYGPSVDAAIERGSASLVLLKRRLGVGYARAASLMEALVTDGILGEMTASGSRPTLLSAAEWARRSKAVVTR